MVASILTVCTANICRSPMAEAALSELTYINRLDVNVTSAGARARNGSGADQETVAVAAEMGLLLDRHRSRRLTAQMIADQDLILCAEVDHLFAVVDLLPEAFERTFLLLQLADQALGRKDGEHIVDWVSRHHAGRTPHGVLQSAGQYNLGDPYRTGRKKIAAALGQIIEASRALAKALAGSSHI